MAPTAKVDQRRPGMLPADFGEWDSKESPDTLPEGFDGFDAASSTLVGKSPSIPPAKPQASGRTLADRIERPKGSRQSNGHANAIGIAAPAEKPEPLKPSNRATARAGASSVAALAREEEVDRKNLQIEEDTKGKKKVFIATGSVLVLLTATSLIYFSFRPKAVPLQNSASIAVQPQTQITSEKPSPSTPISPTEVPAQSAPVDPAPVPRVKPDMMDNQLAAPTRISRDLRSVGDQQAPGLSGVPIEGMGGNGGEMVSSVFGGKRGVVVKADIKAVNISAGVATGLLVKKTQPVYPAIAVSSHVAGKVVLQATISKLGTIEDLHVVSGPVMLRRAALDAVKTWKYRPYLLNNQPVGVETTVDVNFTLGR